MVAAVPTVRTTFRLNGAQTSDDIPVWTTLLDWLRDHAGLTGAKKGCDRGQCGACTVLIDGERHYACLRLAVTLGGRDVLTIEGLGAVHDLHQLQRAFVDCDAMQCGFCTPGQIMSGIAVIAEGHASDAEMVRQWMSGNLCRCAAYPNIVAAILSAAQADAV